MAEKYGPHTPGTKIGSLLIWNRKDSMCENNDPPGERESFPPTTEFLQQREFSFFFCVFYNGVVTVSQGRAWLYLWIPCWPIYLEVKAAKVTILDSHWPSTSMLASFLSTARIMVSILHLPESTQEKEDSLDQVYKVSYPWLRIQNLRLPDSPKCSKQNKAPRLPGLVKLNG